jgi:hypothetical protein
MHDARTTRLNASEAVTRNSGSTAIKLAGGIAISRTTDDHSRDRDPHRP